MSAARREPRRLKCYTGNLDGSRKGLVIARNQTEAARIAGTSLYDFRNHWRAVERSPLESAKPGFLYTRPYDGGEWQLGRRPLPRKVIHGR